MTSTAFGDVLWRWRKLPPFYRRWIVMNAVVGAGAMNCVLGGGIAWLSAHDAARVPLWALPSPVNPSMATDVVGTLFFLPLITSLLFTTLAWRQLRSGALPPIGRLDPPDSPLGRLPSGRLGRGAVLGGLLVLTVSPLLLIFLAAVRLDDMSPGQFAVFKAVMGTVLGVIVTPLVALLAVTGPRPTVPAGSVRNVA